MTVVGYRGKLNMSALINTLIKHANMSKGDANAAAKKIESGQSMRLEANFLLEEDLRDLGVLISH